MHSSTAISSALSSEGFRNAVQQFLFFAHHSYISAPGLEG